MPAVSSKTPTECSQILFYLFQVSSNPFKLFCNTLNCACLQIWDLPKSYWFTRCCCLSAAPCLCLLPRQSQRWVAALNLKCISTSKALGKLLLFYPSTFACLEDQEPRLLTFFSFPMNNCSRIWDSWYTSLLHSLPVPTCLRPLFCYISIYFEQRLKMKTK